MKNSSYFLVLRWIISFSILTPCFSQTSFVRKLDVFGFPPNTSILSYAIEADLSGGISMAAIIGINTLSVISLSPEGEAQSAYQILTAPGTWLRAPSYYRSGNYHLVSAMGSIFQNNRSAVFGLNFETGTYWGRQIGLNSVTFTEVCISSDNSALFSNRMNALQGEKLNLSKLDMTNGTSIWDYFYQRENSNIVKSYIAYNIQEFPNNNYSISGRATHLNNRKSEYLLKLSADGIPLKGVAIESDSISFLTHSIDEAGNVFIAGSVVIDTIQPFPNLLITLQDGFITKLDPDYNVQWVKQLKAERFPCTDLSIKAFPDGSLIFMYITFGSFPVIVGKLSPEGDLLWHRGYSLLNPRAALGQDSSIFLLSRNLFQGETNPTTILKTTPNGNIAGCPQFPACLSLTDMPLTLETWEWTHDPAPPLPEIEVQVASINYSTTPHCGTPEPPSPVFSLPDTVCQFSCLSPGDLKNRLAHHRQWRLTGPGVDTIIVDSTFSWCYDVPGLYTVEQEVWLLGCSDIFSRNIQILPDNLTPPLGEDRNLCNDPPYQLVPVSSRPLRTFLWSDGSGDSSFNVPASGTYQLNASDGYCNITDTVALHFVRAGLTGLPLDPGPDTTLCPEFLPYILRPQSAYSDVFFLNGATQPAQEFALTQPGNYTLTTFIEDCPFQETIMLEVEPCPVPIYLPSAFSPNDDGVNDRCFPQGEDYEGIFMEVYDRWGGMLHRTTAAPFSWDGKSDGKTLGHGVYVLVFYYKNLRTLKEERLVQEVVLLY